MPGMCRGIMSGKRPQTHASGGQLRETDLLYYTDSPVEPQMTGNRTEIKKWVPGQAPWLTPVIPVLWEAK